MLDAAAMGLVSVGSNVGVLPPAEALVVAVGLAGLNALAYYVVKAELSIAGKSFTHMKNTIL